MTIWALGVIISFIFLINVARDCMRKDGTEDFLVVSYLCCLIVAVLFSWFGIFVGLLLKGIRND